jgi:hypothetical protein
MAFNQSRINGVTAAKQVIYASGFALDRHWVTASAIQLLMRTFESDIGQATD